MFYDINSDLSSLAKILKKNCCKRNKLDALTDQENAYGEISTRLDLLLDDILIEYFRCKEDVRAVYSEELGITDFRRKGYYAVVDPLDGTRNFQMGLSYYATSVALLDDTHNVVAAFVINLATGNYYSAVKGGGSFFNGKRIVHQNRFSLEIREIDAIFVGLSHSTEELSILMKIASQTHSFRAMGCAALDLCCLALGRCGLFVDLSNTAKLVDVLAAALVVEETGAVVMDMHKFPITHIPTETAQLDEAVYKRKFRVIGANDLNLYTMIANSCKEYHL